MEDLIRALQIFAKYDNPAFPTSCEHDVLYVHIDPALVSDDDKCDLTVYGFDIDHPLGNFYSTRFGSA
jgi:hypothetical protein